MVLGQLNGVILIETKRGKEGGLQVNFDSSYGVSSINRRYDVLTTPEWKQLVQESIQNNPRSNFNVPRNVYNPDDPAFNPESTETFNWIDEGTRAAAIQNYSLNISAGTKKSNFAFGLGYNKTENPLIGSDIDFERYSVSINSDHNITDWLKVGQSLRIVRSLTQSRAGNNFMGYTLVSPWQPLFDPNGPNGFALPHEPIDGNLNEQGAEIYGQNVQKNFLAQQPFFREPNLLFRTPGNLYAEIKPIKNVRIRGYLWYRLPF